MNTDANNRTERERTTGTYQDPATTSATAHYERIIGYDVVDRNNNYIGTVHNLWTDEAGQPAFLGVKTGWIFGKIHVVPVHTGEVSERTNRVRLPFTEEKVKNAPASDPDLDLSPAQQEEIHRYYETTYEAAPRATEPAAGATAGQGRIADEGEEVRVPLREEEVRIGKREVELGGVRLRKIVRTEVVDQPVELRREDIVIERVPGSEARATDTGTPAFEQDEVFIPLRREEPIVQKDVHVREEVRVGKKVTTEQQNISESVRKEDVEIDRGREDRRAA